MITIAWTILTGWKRQALENIRYQFMICRKNFSCVEKLTKFNDRIQYHSAMTMNHIWTSSYLMNQTHIATIGSNEIHRFDEKYIRSFFPVNFIDRYRLKTVASGNYDAETKLSYRIGSFLNLFWNLRIWRSQAVSRFSAFYFRNRLYRAWEAEMFVYYNWIR